MQRYWHVACSYFCHSKKSTGPKLAQVVIYGGAKRDPSVAKTQFIGMGDLMILSFSNVMHNQVVFNVNVWVIYSGTKTLKHLCLSAIASALQKSGRVADPSQLCDQLPDSIPPAIKHSITVAYKDHALTS